MQLIILLKALEILLPTYKQRYQMSVKYYKRKYNFITISADDNKIKCLKYIPPIFQDEMLDPSMQ